MADAQAPDTISSALQLLAANVFMLFSTRYRCRAAGVHAALVRSIATCYAIRRRSRTIR
jgi:hypothetical protein